MLRSIRVLAFKTLTASSALIALGACDYDANPLGTLTLNPGIHASVSRSDGLQISDLPAFVQERYGFQPVSMTWVMPQIQVQADPKHDEQDAPGPDFKTIATSIAEEAILSETVSQPQTLPFELTIDEAPFYSGWESSGCETLADVYKYGFEAAATATGEVLKQEMKLRIKGYRVEQDGNLVEETLELSPRAVDFECYVDFDQAQDCDWNWISKNGLRCQGLADFVLGDQ